MKQIIATFLMFLLFAGLVSADSQTWTASGSWSPTSTSAKLGEKITLNASCYPSFTKPVESDASKGYIINPTSKAEIEKVSISGDNANFTTLLSAGTYYFMADGDGASYTGASIYPASYPYATTLFSVVAEVDNWGAWGEHFDTIWNLASFSCVEPVVMDFNVSTCQELDVENGRYNLTSNVSGSSPCLVMSANNVSLNCFGYYADSIDMTTGYDYTTIKNCQAGNINTTGSDNSIFDNNSIVYFYPQDNYNMTATDNKLNYTEFGGSLNEGVFAGNNFTFWSSGYSSGLALYFNNTTSGNWWVGYSGSCTNANNDTVCDAPFDIFSDGSYYDYLPITGYNYTVPITPNNTAYPYSYNVCNSSTVLFLHNVSYPNGTFSYTDNFIVCPYGCSIDKCSEPKLDFLFNIVILILAVVGTIIFSVLIGSKTKPIIKLIVFLALVIMFSLFIVVIPILGLSELIVFFVIVLFVFCFAMLFR